MNTIIISNTCIGNMLIKKYNIYPYNNPFISTLIPNDTDYIKLINLFQNMLRELKNKWIYLIRFPLNIDIAILYTVFMIEFL